MPEAWRFARAALAAATRGLHATQQCPTAAAAAAPASRRKQSTFGDAGSNAAMVTALWLSQGLALPRCDRRGAEDAIAHEAAQRSSGVARSLSELQLALSVLVVGGAALLLAERADSAMPHSPSIRQTQRRIRPSR